MSVREHHRVRAVLLLALAVLAANLTAVGVRSTAGADDIAPGATMGALAGEAVPEPTTTSSTTTSTTTTTVVEEVLPQPISPPGADYIEEPEIVIGRLEIPALSLDTTLYQGISLTSIDRGPSQWPGSAMPGHEGNVVVAGHRVTHSRPFRHLDQLVPGDQAIMSTNEGVFVYEFTGHEIVTPDRVDIADQYTGEYKATFFACHPPGSARYRIVAYWRLISAPVG